MSIAPGETVPKDPEAKTFHAMDWSDWLNPNATLDTYTIDIDGDGVLDYDNDSKVNTDTAIQFRLLAGTRGKRYKVTVHIVTDESPAQEDDRSFFVQVRNR